MLLVTGTIRLPADRLDEARPVMRRMVEASRDKDGCAEYAYAEDLFEPGLIRVLERWRRDALTKHFASKHISAWRAAWSDLQIGDRDLVVYEIGPPQPI